MPKKKIKKFCEFEELLLPLSRRTRQISHDHANNIVSRFVTSCRMDQQLNLIAEEVGIVNLVEF
jgi:hypothetical protein